MPSPHARSGARKRKKEGSRGLRKGPLHSRNTFREREPYDRGARHRCAGCVAFPRFSALRTTLCLLTDHREGAKARSWLSALSRGRENC